MKWVHVSFVNYLKIFLANTSIRGFSRIVKTESGFIKILWTSFIIINTVFLGISIYRVVMDYCQYSVNVQTYTKFDNGTPFPAVTFCNHQPFSLTAYDLWDSGKVMSPTEFNKKLRLIALRYINESMEKFPNMNVMDSVLMWSTIMDRISIYYQSLDADVSIKLGHPQTMFHNCMWWYGKQMAFGDNCNDSMLIVKRFSHPLYFNCYTVEMAPNVSMDISRLGAIIWLGPDEALNKKHKQGFLFDIFEQAYGLRVAIHEPGSYPDIEKIGFQIEPGRLNELNFQPVLNIRVDSPTKRCRNQPDVKYKDLDLTYNYDNQLCLNHHMQKAVTEHCKCLYGYFPRHIIPNSTYPYCGHFNDSNHKMTITRMNCVQNVTKFMVNQKKILEDKTCLLRCSDIQYDLTVSVTKWRSTEWQLYWMKKVVEDIQNYDVNLQQYHKLAQNNSEKEAKLSAQVKEFVNYLQQTNLSLGLHKDFEQSYSHVIFGSRFSFVVVKRRENNTSIKEERLVLTVSALISRIGGLCSLYMGLTFAFFVELIEHFYICLFPTSSGEKIPETKKDVKYISGEKSVEKSLVETNKTCSFCNCRSNDKGTEMCRTVLVKNSSSGNDDTDSSVWVYQNKN